MMESAAARLSRAEWLADPDSRGLMKVLNAGGIARFVGGCVRNTLLGEAVTDMDIATTLQPEKVMEILGNAGIKTVATGIDHGTVTAVMSSRHFEVTTLRIDVATDGRHADVAFTDDWHADAARRDFTINALYCDADGKLFDPLETGLADLKAGRVCFIGDAAARIAEDYLRILRFFRFHGRYGKDPLDAEGLKAVLQAREGLRRLSGERVRDELLKIVADARGAETISGMKAAGILDIVLPEAIHFERLKAVEAIDAQQLFPADAILRLGVLIEEAGVESVATRLRLSNKDRDRLLKLHADKTEIVSYLSMRELRRTLYLMGHQLFRDRVMLVWAENGAERQAAQWLALIALADNWQRPAFPLTGDMIKASGVPEGPLVGQVRREIEKWWIDSDFPDDEPALAERLKTVAQGMR